MTRRTPAIAALLTLAALAAPAAATDEQTAPTQHTMALPSEQRQWYRNPDGSCVQCSIGMCGVWQNIPQAYTLLWDTTYGPAVRGGSNPSRVEAYADRRNIPIYNVTGRPTFEWMKWAAKTGRFAAIGAGTAHFQTLYAYDPDRQEWYVCNNNSPRTIDAYTQPQFERLHLASGQWIVILDAPPAAPPPKYINWWKP